MTRKIVFDIETKNTFADIGSNDPSELDLSLVAIHDSDDDSYHSFLEDELTALWPRIERTDILIGYNSNHFDIPLLNKYYPGDLTAVKSVDLLEEVKNSLGRRLKLDHIAEATLGEKKSGHGLQAITWWQKGEIEKIRKYCVDDVRITKEIYEYALSNKSLKYSDGSRVSEIRLDPSHWETGGTHAMTHTLPF